MHVYMGFQDLLAQSGTFFAGRANEENGWCNVEPPTNSFIFGIVVSVPLVSVAVVNIC